MRLVDFHFEYDYILEDTIKATIQRRHNKCLCDNSEEANEVFKDYLALFTERKRGDDGFHEHKKCHLLFLF